MPMTFQPWAPLTANPIDFRGHKVVKLTINEVLKDVTQAEDPLVVLQSTFDKTEPPEKVIPSINGLVSSIVSAYAGHHHLVIRPDDVWFAILTQFSSYVNAHAEELRGKFVAHEGQKELRIDYFAFDRWHADYGRFAEDMSVLIQKNLEDPELKDWIIPEFTTTTDNDRVVASIIMMGTLQKYFTYTMGIICGLPSVTLEGEQRDYEAILARLEKLTEYGDEPSQFAALLRPVLRRFVRTFEQPDSEETVYFWRRILSVDNTLCGVTTYTGWVNAFSFWNELGRPLTLSQYYRNADWENDDGRFGIVERQADDGHAIISYKRLLLELDGVRYHAVNSRDVPPAWTKVPITIDDHGTKVKAEMTAGLLGVECSRSAELVANGSKASDTMQPMAAWWIHQTPEQPQLDSGVLSSMCLTANYWCEASGIGSTCISFPRCGIF